MKGLIILTKTLGDVVIGNVLVKNIKLQYPDMELDYIVEEAYKPLVEYNPYIKKIYTIENTVKDWDIVLQIATRQEYTKVFMFQQTSGYDNRWHQRESDRHQHLLDYYAKRYNIEIKDRKLELYCKDNLLMVDRKNIVIAIHTKTLVDVKNWSKFGELTTVLKDRLNCEVLQLCEKFDEKVLGAKKVVLSLFEVVEFFKKKECDLFIGLDSGLSYIATAMEMPVIELLGATTFITSGTWGNKVEVLSSNRNKECQQERGDICCHGINGGLCKYGQRCIDSILVEQVLDLVESVLRKEKKWVY